MPYWNLVPSRARAVSPSAVRAPNRILTCSVLLLLAGITLVLPALGTGYARHQIERTIAADQVVTADVYRTGRAVYRTPEGEIDFARVPDRYPTGSVFDFLRDPAGGRLQPLDQTPPAGWLPITFLATGGVLLLTGLALLPIALRRKQPGFDPTSSGPRWEANIRLILYGRRARPDTPPPETPVVGSWLPPEPDSQPPTGHTGVLRLGWVSPTLLAAMAAALSFALPQLGGPGREAVMALGATALWLPAVGAALAAAVYQVRVTPDGELVIRTLVRRRRYDLTQLVQVTGWTWAVDTRRRRAGLPRLGCWNLGLHLRTGRYLFWSPTNVRDHELVGRAIRWWALRTGAAVTPDMAYGLGLIPDPRAVEQSPLPVVHDDPVLRRPARRIHSSLIYIGHVGLVFAVLGALPAVAVAANATVGPAPDPRVFAQPCDLLTEVEVRTDEPYRPADDPPAWQGCGAGEQREVWLTVNPSVHAAPRAVRHWLETNEQVAAAPILDPVLLAELEVDYAHLVLYHGGARVTIAYIAGEVAGIASVTDRVTDPAGRPLTDAERFDAAVAIVQAVTGSPQGNQPVRSLRGVGAGTGNREAAIEAARELRSDVEQLTDWLARFDRSSTVTSRR